MRASMFACEQGLRKTRFKQMCSWGRFVYRWTAMSYSALQMFQNPWLVQVRNAFFEPFCSYTRTLAGIAQLAFPGGSFAHLKRFWGPVEHMAAQMMLELDTHTQLRT